MIFSFGGAASLQVGSEAGCQAKGASVLVMAWWSHSCRGKVGWVTSKWRRWVWQRRGMYGYWFGRKGHYKSCYPLSQGFGLLLIYQESKRGAFMIELNTINPNVNSFVHSRRQHPVCICMLFFFLRLGNHLAIICHKSLANENRKGRHSVTTVKPPPGWLPVNIACGKRCAGKKCVEQ